MLAVCMGLQRKEHAEGRHKYESRPFESRIQARLKTTRECGMSVVGITIKRMITIKGAVSDGDPINIEGQVRERKRREGYHQIQFVPNLSRVEWFLPYPAP